MARASAVRIGLKYVAGPVIIACIAFFFYRAFQRNWASIQAQHVDFKPEYLALSVVCMLVTYLVPTYGWQLTINALGGGKKLTFSQTVATVNSSNLVKYVPGKVLTYALQMYWLANRGFSKSLVIYVNALNLLISLAVSIIFGFGCLFFAPSPIPSAVTAGIVVTGVVLDMVGFKYHAAVLKLMIRIYNRVFKRDVGYVEVPGSLLARLHLVHLISVVAFSISAYFTSLGIGYYLPLSAAPRLMAAILISDTIAFFAVITPGGLGVREGIMYFALGGAKGTSLAITLPIATRAVHMFVDLLLGGTAFKLLGNLTRVPGAVAPDDPTREPYPKAEPR
jgi:glycosyltransferase 2 family protein